VVTGTVWPLVPIALIADELQRRSGLLRLLQRDHGGERRVGIDLLLDRGKLHQLLGELVGIERRGRILVLQLGGQQLKEFVEIARQIGAGRG